MMNRTKLAAVSAGALAAVAIGYQMRSAQPDPIAEPALLPAPTETPDGQLVASADHEAIFKRAFWRRPEAGDRIVNAELSEWLEDGAEVSRWQWFIEVEPSPELSSWLRERNPFALVKSDAQQIKSAAAAAPAWFPNLAGGFEIYSSPDGGTNLLFSREGNRLFATASGYGFARGAANPVAPVAATRTKGRLPLTPPPDPPRP